MSLTEYALVLAVISAVAACVFKSKLLGTLAAVWVLLAIVWGLPS